ncbi:DnaT-like ssDNA-binding domain-containing protein [Pseudomonas bohemica]|uniref:DnaT-like ssDNA-binding domain-containing protein n=1 Tax=Pseudomonas bohemica TaxID=2044872 RepID=UPI000DA61D0C|nr:DnaT-like ssDNA-binding domain-containing protein [Pseudomonas bohemica]
MARARNIKPGLFSNELIAELPAFDRLLFIGLWCLADREGRLEDRPKRIKMELFPCDTYDVDQGLASLAEAKFITRYSVDGFSAIEIDNFQKHQRPHGTEKDSTIPDVDGFLTVHERKANGVVTGVSRKVNVKDVANNVKEQLEPVNPPLDNALIHRFSDSPIPEEHQHHSLNAGEGDPASGAVVAETYEGFGDLEDTPEEQPEQPVDPKAPVEMTLDWKPDAKLLKTYCVHFGVSPDLFTHEATASFTAHHESTGGLNTQAKWVSMLVGWVKSDRAKASNVRQFPARRHSAEPDFDSTAWADNLVVNP